MLERFLNTFAMMPRSLVGSAGLPCRGVPVAG